MKHQQDRPPGLLLVISGPSGSGKTTIARDVEQRLGGSFSVSATTRPKAAGEIEGPDGIAADVSRAICEFADAHPDKLDRTLTIVGRAGALFPFFRTSSLLKHLDGRTRNVPVVLLYPGERRGDTGLSFMGVVNADSDYRPRIYP